MSTTYGRIAIADLPAYPGPLQNTGAMAVDDGVTAYRVSPQIVASYAVGKAEAYNNGLLNGLNRTVAARLRECISVWDFLSPAVQAQIESGAEVPIGDALAKAMARGKRSYVLPPGNYSLDRSAVFSAAGQSLIMNGANIRAVGNFNLFANDGLDNTLLEGGLINAAGMTGGSVLRLSNAGRTRFSRTQVNGAWNGVEIVSCNNVTGYDLNLGGVRGEFAYRITGEGSGRTDIVRLYACGATGTDTSALAGMKGFDLWGPAYSVELYGCHMVRPGIGLHARAKSGVYPFGVVANGFAAADFSAYENMRLEGGEKFFFGTGFYGHAAGTLVYDLSYNEAPGVYIGPDCQYVEFAGGGITSPRLENIVSGGREVKISGMTLARYETAQRAGKTDTIRLLGSTNNFRVTDSTLGSRSGIGAQSRYQIMVEAGARNIVACNNNADGYFLDFLCDRSGGDLGNIQHHGNTGARYSEVDGIRQTRFAGAHADFEAVIVGGAVTGWTKRSGGNDWTVAPAGWQVIGDGTGATATVSLDGLGGLNATPGAGGSGYTWAGLSIVPAVTTPHVAPARMDTAAAADVALMATGGAAAILGNSRGVGMKASADANAVNYLIAQGRGTGFGAELRAEGADADIHTLLVPKGVNGHPGFGNAKVVTIEGVEHVYVFVNGNLRLLELKAVPV